MAASLVQTALISILLGSTATDSQELPPPLTIGNASPKLAAMTFLKGEAVTELSAGMIYVVEFSGTQCVPCVECIPHMNELQKKHAGVVFISVFGEPVKEVRRFLAGQGKNIAIRVAADPTGRMSAGWMEPAYQEGIPTVFVVGKDKKIAWIGHPVNLAEPLARVVAGTFEVQEDSLRLKVEQEAARRLQQARAREEKGRNEYERINELTRAGKLADALSATEKALAVYHDCPRATELLQLGQVWLLANSPGRREEGFQFASELAVKAKMSGRWSVMTTTARTLLAAVEKSKPEARDKRLIDLVLPLICDPSPFDPDLRHENERGLKDILVINLRTRGRAYYLRGDMVRATGAIRDAMALIRNLKPPPGADEKKFTEDIRRQLADFQAVLKEYSEMSVAPHKD